MGSLVSMVSLRVSSLYLLRELSLPLLPLACSLVIYIYSSGTIGPWTAFMEWLGVNIMPLSHLRRNEILN